MPQNHRPNSSSSGNDGDPEKQPNLQRQARCFKKRRHHFDQRRRDLEAEFCDLLDPRSSSGRLLYAFARGRVQQFHLTGHCQEAYLVNEAYKRTINAHEKGETIRNLPAWLKMVIYRICQEEARNRQRCVPIDNVPEIEDSTISIEQLQHDLVAYGLGFQVVMQEVEPLDREILILKVIENMSWRQIRERLQQKGFGDHSEANLRKRKERLLIRLRKRYHSYKPDDF